MSDAVAELAPARPTGLMAWLRYDESRVPEVEAAYNTYIRATQPGVYAFVASLASGFAWYFTWSIVRPISPPDAAAIAFIVSGLVVYGIFIYSISRCPFDVFVTVLKGCVDVRRACIFAAVTGAAISLLEMPLIHWLVVQEPAPPHVVLMPRLYLVLFGQLSGLTLAPFGEEFFFQGWLQTRLRGTGSFWSAAITTVLFVLYHGPKRPSDFVRVFGLGFFAYLRAGSRSLGACIVAHAAYNAVVTIVVLFTLLTGPY
jgi:membrane protease YdiL (CAAX protease family)